MTTRDCIKTPNSMQIKDHFAEVPVEKLHTVNLATLENVQPDSLY